MNTKPPCRLFAILARKAPIGVIFRRGPSDWVRLIKWHTDTDEIERGQWFHGRIYEKRCDLSPHGHLLVYFAAKRFKIDPAYTGTWTAVSKPPYLTALGLWPKGDSWAGGGLFKHDKELFLNHRLDASKPHKDHLPQNLKVEPNPDAYGEDSPIYDIRLLRDGWELRQELECHEVKKAYVTDKPEIYTKSHADKSLNLLMITSNNSPDGITLVSEFSLELPEYGVQYPVSDATWADWDQRGRLVFVKEGILFAADVDESGVFIPVQIEDFNDDEPEAIESPEWAKKW